MTTGDDSGGFGEALQPAFVTGLDDAVAFTRLALQTYSYRCAISGLEFAAEERMPHPHLDVFLLRPLSAGGALGFHNLLVLEEQVARAMRSGQLAVDAQFRLILPQRSELSPALLPHASAGQSLFLPGDARFRPSAENLAYHRGMYGL